MKYKLLILSLLLVGCANPSTSPTQRMAVSAPPSANSPALPVGKVMAFIVQGDVQRKDTDGTVRALTRNDVLQQGTTIISGTNGNAVLVFSNGFSVKIPPNAEFEIVKFLQAPFDEKTLGSFLRLSADPSKSITEIYVHSGQVLFDVQKLNKAAGSTFVLNTPAGRADLRD